MMQGTGLHLAGSLSHMAPELQGQSQPQQPSAGQPAAPNQRLNRAPGSAKAAPVQPAGPPPQARPSSEEPAGGEWESLAAATAAQQGMHAPGQPSRSGLGSASSSKPSPPTGTYCACIAVDCVPVPPASRLAWAQA